jgi:serine/threonine protein kinase
MTDPRAAQMPERDLQEQVRQLCAGLGLYHYHPHNSRHSAPGWPDSTIIGRGGILHRELKTEHGSLSPEQRHVGELIRQAGGNWRLSRPRDLLDGSIGRELADLAAVQLALFGSTP